MSKTVAIYFKDGTQITVNPKTDDFGLWDLGNELSLNVHKGILYKKKGNVICGEDITNTIKTIEISIQY